LHDVAYRLVASPAYLECAPPIETPGDVAAHAQLAYTLPAFRECWRFQRDNTVEEVEFDAAVKISNAAALADGARKGMGLALLADWLVDRDIETGALIALLPEWKAGGAGPADSAAVWTVTPSRAFVPAKTRAFDVFLRAALGKPLSRGV